MSSQAGQLQEAAIEVALIALAAHPATIPLFAAYSLRELRDRLALAFAWDDQTLPDPATIEPSALLAHWQSQHTAFAADQITMLWDDPAFAEAIAWQPAVPIPASSSDKILSAWQTVRSAVDILRAESDVIKRLAVLLNFPKIDLKGGSESVWHGELSVVKIRLKTIREGIAAVQDLIGEPPGDLDAQAAALTPAWLHAIHAVQEQYRILKEAAGALDFDDLERRTRDLLQNESVARRYRNAEFKHVMIDEFQDTNAAQRDILIGLTGYAPGSLFVVGDPKQAIYGFRGAQAAVFDEVAAALRDSGGFSVTLDTSFRAHQGLIAAQNTLFGALFPDLPADQVAMRSPRPAEDHHMPTMEILALDPSVAPENHNKAEPMRAIEAELLAARLKTLIEVGTPIWDRSEACYRPATYGDCAVLSRSHDPLRAVEAAFKAAELPYVTIGGRGFFRQEEVRDLTALLNALYNPADELALAIALRSPLFAISDDALFGLRLLYPAQSLWAALTGPVHTDQPDREAVLFARQALLMLRTLVGRLSLADLLSKTLAATGYLAVLAGLPDGVRRIGNVEKLIDRARHAGPIGLGDFAAQLADASERELREGEVPLEVGNAIRLMTIHASKGLEFPIVAIFNTGTDRASITDPLLWDNDPAAVAPAFRLALEDDDSDQPGKVPFAYRTAAARTQAREQAEATRVWYVAVTRAADRLLISGNIGNLSKTPAKASIATNSDKAGSWLHRTLAALIPLHKLTSADPPIRLSAPDGAWSIQLRIPAQLIESANSRIAHPNSPETGWARIDRGAPIVVSPYQPPLSAPLPSPANPTPKTVTATNIARLGQAVTQSDAARRARLMNKLRAELFQAAPPEMPMLQTSAETESPVDRRRQQVVGEMVHRALQFDLLHRPSAEIRPTLEVYAWQLGLRDTAAIRAIVEARELLDQLDRPLNDLIGKPVQQHRELPFTVQLQGRTISGQIDLLFFDGQRWTILDYKTDNVTIQTAYRHAQRYYAQLGVYAMAVKQITGQPPKTCLYYIRAATLVVVNPADWQTALTQLSDNLDQLAEPLR